LGQADAVVALACMMRTPVDPDSEIQGTIYGMDGIALGFLRERRVWEDRIPAEEDEARTSGSQDGTWKTVDDDGRFPSLIDLFLRHGGSLETVENLIRGVKARADQEMENWCPIGSASGLPPIRLSPTSSWMIERRTRSGSTSRSSASG